MKEDLSDSNMKNRKKMQISLVKKTDLNSRQSRRPSEISEPSFTETFTVGDYASIPEN